MTFDQLRMLVRELADRRVASIKLDAGVPMRGRFNRAMRERIVGEAIYRYVTQHGPLKCEGMVIGPAATTRGYLGLRAHPNLLRELIDRLCDAELKNYGHRLLTRWKELRDARDLQAAPGVQREDAATDANRFSQSTFRGFD